MEKEQKQLALCWMAAVIFGGLSNGKNSHAEPDEHAAVRSAVKIFSIIEHGLNKKENGHEG